MVWVVVLKLVSQAECTSPAVIGEGGLTSAHTFGPRSSKGARPLLPGALQDSVLEIINGG